MLKRNEYIEIIEEIRNLEKISIDEYINKRLEPLKQEDSHFIEVLYKDIYYLIKDINKKGDNEFEIKNGSIVLESDGLHKSIKLTGYQSRLHQVSIWLHMQIIEKLTQESPLHVIEKMENFEQYFMQKANYTPEYKAQLDKIKNSLKRERRQNLGKGFTNRIIGFFEFLSELKINIGVTKFSIAELINKLKT